MQFAPQPTEPPRHESDGKSRSSGSLARAPWAALILARVLARARALLSSPRAPALIIAAGLLLTSGALSLGLTADDYFHLVGVRPAPGLSDLARRPWDLFAFVPGDPRATERLMDAGVFPWWSDPGVRIAFFRPLSSLTHWLDYALWPSLHALMHLHSMLWYALLLAVLARVYQRLCATPAIAALALALYALDDARASAVGWLATRNLLIALSFALLAVYWHDRARSERDAKSRWLAPAALGVGLLAGEAAVQGFAYLVAYALYLDRGTLRARLASLLPYVALLLAWRIPYSLFGYGAQDSGLYFDPGREPGLFLQALAVRLPVLLLAQFALPFSDLWDAVPAFAPGAEPWWLALAAAVLLGLAWLLAPLWRRDRRVRFWGLGALLAAIPVCSGPLDDRLLAGPGIGCAALLAQLFAAWAGARERDHRAARADSHPQRVELRGAAQSSESAHPRVRALAVGGLALLHLAFAPLLLPLRTLGVDAFEVLMTRADASIPSTPDIERQTLVALNPPVDLFAIYFPPYRAGRGIPRPAKLRWLATGISALEVERLDARTLRLRPQAGYLSNSTQWMLRSPRRPLREGEEVVLSDATFQVTELTADQRPAEVLVHFREPLESPTLRFVQWGKREYVPFTPPRVGETMRVPAVDMATALLGPS